MYIRTESDLMLIAQLARIFLDVLTPVFILVILGYVSGPRLGLDARTLSRFAYYILTPVFVFDVLSRARIGASLALQMSVYTIIVLLLCVGLALLVARLLRRSPRMTSAYVLVAVFANVGNFGLPIIQFAYGDGAMPPTTVYFLTIVALSLAVGVAAANSAQMSFPKALLVVVRTPALFVLPPALLCSWLAIELPSVVARPISLLSAAMVPTMLFVLGMQLASTPLPRLNMDMVIACGIRLIGSPLIAIALAPVFGLSGLERSVGIMQVSMPVAVLATIVANEYDLEPAFINGTVLFSTVASLFTLALLLAL